MSRKRTVMMVGGTVACALGIGFFMQRADTAMPRALIAPLPATVQQSVLVPAGTELIDDATHLEIQKVRLTSAMPDFEPPALSVPRLEGMTFHRGAPAAARTNGATPDRRESSRCDVSATAEAGDMAMVDLSLTAPCNANRRVTVHHSGMIFSELTDRNGNLSVTVPALSERAVFMFAFEDGSGTVALTRVPDLKGIDRIVLQWTGDAGFQVHAREFGAEYGGAGHVWAESPPQMPHEGTMVRLGSPAVPSPQLADVYSFPTDAQTREGVVALSVEAEVTAQNCGRDITAQTLELRGNAPLRTRELVLSVPDCSAIGDFLVLTDMVEDLEVASR